MGDGFDFGGECPSKLLVVHGGHGFGDLDAGCTQQSFRQQWANVNPEINSFITHSNLLDEPMKTPPLNLPLTDLRVEEPLSENH